MQSREDLLYILLLCLLSGGLWVQVNMVEQFHALQSNDDHIYYHSECVTANIELHNECVQTKLVCCM